MSAWPLSSDRRFYPRMVARVGPRSFRIDYPKGLANGIRMLKYLFAGGRVGKPIMNLCSFTAGAVADHHPFSLVPRVPGQNFSVEKVYLAGRTLRRFGGYFEVLPILDLQLSNRLKLQLFEVVGPIHRVCQGEGVDDDGRFLLGESGCRNGEHRGQQGELFSHGFVEVLLAEQLQLITPKAREVQNVAARKHTDRY
jgi:hypothetical protein